MPAVDAKPKLAMYGAASCGGCEVSLLNLGDRLLTLDRIFQLAFCPCIADFKYEDVRRCEDGSIDLCLFNGAIRSTEDEDMSRLLRAKSRILIAYGSCAQEGCVPGLANLFPSSSIPEAVYLRNPSTDPSSKVVPRHVTRVPEGEIELPELAETVRTLDQVVPVDYTIPGCPPEPPRIWSALEPFIASLTSGAPLPPGGAVLGAERVALCEECPFERREVPVRGFRRPHHAMPDGESCHLDQGLVCLGVATRAGCGALCLKAGMGCRGCYGPPEDVLDQGGAMVAALAATVDTGEPGEDRNTIEPAIETAMGTLIDPAGTFYRFSMARSILHRARFRPGGEGPTDDSKDHH